MFVSSLLPYIRECCFVGHLKSIIYYTDSHDVDEDLMTICNYGGYWNGGWSYGSSGVGIAQRHVDNVPTETWDIVASSNI